jgi:peroxiredoxin
MPAVTLTEAFEQARSLDAPLGERLSMYARALRDFNRPLAEAVDRLVDRLKGGLASSASPKEGEVMPSFLLPDHAGRLVSLDHLVALGPVVVTFARGHWCPYCRIAVSALAEIADDVKRLGAQIVVIVPDLQRFAAQLRSETARNADLAESQGNDSWFLPVPATFIVGRDGVIKARHVDPDYRTRMEIDALLSALRLAAQA